MVQTSTPTHNPLLIGDQVPESLGVTDPSGRPRTLMSYKTALDILVVGFFSARCEANQKFWPPLRRLNEAYKDWHVSFVAVSAPPQETLQELSQVLIHERLAWPAVRDDQQAVVHRFNASYAPEVAIIDEFGALRYRGSAIEAGKALETLIGHIDPIPNPEPPMTGGCALP